MSTGAQVRSRIIADLARSDSDITSSVATAIDLAIRHYETEPWWFLETRSTITSSSSQEYYSFPSDYRALDSITIEINNNTYPLLQRPYTTLEDWNVKSSVFIGYPTDYAEYGEEFRLYPVPNGAYPMVLSYRQSKGDPGTASSNAWTTEAEMLITARAEWHLHALKFHDLEAATIAKGVERVAYDELKKLNTQRQTTGTTRRRRV